MVKVDCDWNEWYTYFFYPHSKDNEGCGFLEIEIPQELWERHQKAREEYLAVRNEIYTTYVKKEGQQ